MDTSFGNFGARAEASGACIARVALAVPIAIAGSMTIALAQLFLATLAVWLRVIALVEVTFGTAVFGAGHTVGCVSITFS